jgi:hypothetical protein
MKGMKWRREMKMPAFVEKSAFLRQTWALLRRNTILHVTINSFHVDVYS